MAAKNKDDEAIKFLRAKLPHAPSVKWLHGVSRTIMRHLWVRKAHEGLVATLEDEYDGNNTLDFVDLFYKRVVTQGVRAEDDTYVHKFLLLFKDDAAQLSQAEVATFLVDTRSPMDVLYMEALRKADAIATTPTSLNNTVTLASPNETVNMQIALAQVHPALARALARSEAKAPCPTYRDTKDFKKAVDDVDCHQLKSATYQRKLAQVLGWSYFLLTRESYDEARHQFLMLYKDACKDAERSSDPDSILQALLIQVELERDPDYTVAELHSRFKGILDAKDPLPYFGPCGWVAKMDQKK